MTDKYTKVEDLKEHPMESMFDIEPNTTVTEYTQRTEMVVADSKMYDDKDKEIEKQIEDVYDAAMTVFHDTIKQLDDIEPKYKNKSREAAALFLNTALAAADKKLVMKTNKDKLEHKTSNSTYNQTNLIFDRNELLKTLKNKKEVIDIEPDR